jgi:hypothetical protein
MTLPELIRNLTDRGIEISAKNGRLIVDAPTGSATSEIRAALVEHKAAILAGRPHQAPGGFPPWDELITPEDLARAVTANDLAQWRPRRGRST